MLVNLRDRSAESTVCAATLRSFRSTLLFHLVMVSWNQANQSCWPFNASARCQTEKPLECPFLIHWYGLETEKQWIWPTERPDEHPWQEDPNHHLPSSYWSLWAKKTSEEIRSCWFSPLWMWLWGANSWAHSSDLPTPGDSTPTVLARRHWSGHQALGAGCRTTADSRLPSSHWPANLARLSHGIQKKSLVWLDWKKGGSTP